MLQKTIFEVQPHWLNLMQIFPLKLCITLPFLGILSIIVVAVLLKPHRILRLSKLWYEKPIWHGIAGRRLVSTILHV